MFRVWRLRLLLFGSVAIPSVLGLAQPASPGPRQAAIAAMYPVMIKALEAGNFGQARNICDQWIVWEPDNPAHHYNLACIEARAGGRRLPYALPALQRAAELGFPEIGTLQKDPDLDPLRGDPAFADIVRRVTQNAASLERAAAPGAAGPANAPASPPSPRAIENGVLLAAPEGPAPPRCDRGIPVGLYFMTRSWPVTRRVEQLLWYFAPDGTVYQGIEHGFSRLELALHRGPRGPAVLKDEMLEVTWAEDRRSTGRLERKAGGFSWNGGDFTPVKPFTAGMEIPGVYEGVASISVTGNQAAVARRLELRPDGTFHWDGVSFLGSLTDASRVHAGANGEDSRGRWHIGSYSLVLVDSKGNLYRRIAFPCDERDAAGLAGRIFFGGTLFQRKEPGAK